jgi:uncharacterized protein
MMDAMAAGQRDFMVRGFRPPWWLRPAHAQTLGGKIFRPAPAVDLRRQRLETPDGDFLDLDVGPAPTPAAPQAVVLHGLEGSGRRRYALVTYRELLAAGIQPIGLNFRSCSGELNRTARLYHSGETTDLHFVLEHLEREAPGRRRGAVGYSLGGNVLLKLLGERGESLRGLLQAAVAVSVPFDLSAGATQLEAGPMGRLYTWYFMRGLRRKTAAKAALIAPHCQLERVLRTRTLREFDDAATAPLHGFADAEDYYARSSSGPLLGGIRVPTLLLQAVDDPFLPAAALPRDAVRSNPYITAAFVAGGGHLGFIGGTPWRPHFWAETEAARFLRAQLGDGEAGAGAGGT